MRSPVVLVLVLLTAFVPASARQARTEEIPTFAVLADQRMMAFAAALVVAGYDAPPASPEQAKLRAEVRQALAGIDPSLKSRLEVAYRRNRRADVDEEADAVRYRALAFAVTPPPAFATPIAASQLPPDLRPISGFAALAAELYRSRQYRALLPALAAAYGEATTRVAQAAQPAVDETLAYLRTKPVDRIEMPAVQDDKGNLVRPPSTRYRKVKVFADPLVGGRLVVVRDDLRDAADEPFAQRDGDRYAVFAGPSMRSDEPAFRLALLRFVVAPLVDGNREVLDDERLKLDALLARHEAARARYENARLALVADSLVSALGARQLVRSGRLSDNGAVDVLGVAYERGEALALHFYDRLKRFEEVGIDIAVFYPDFLHSLDPLKERGRLEQVAAARAALAAEPARPAPSEAFAAEILEADRMITEKRFAEARPILERILAESAGNARALFGLAQVIERQPDETEQDQSASDEDRAAAQMERLERAVNLYRRAALNATERERWLASWSHVYAGRILDFLELRDEAVAEYQAAVKIGEVPQGAFREAQAGLAKPYGHPDSEQP